MMKQVYNSMVELDARQSAGSKLQSTDLEGVRLFRQRVVEEHDPGRIRSWGTRERSSL